MTAPAARAAARPCVHRWVLPAADGREMLPARCRRCGATRLFIAGELYHRSFNRGAGRLQRQQREQRQQGEQREHPARIVRLAGAVDFAPRFGDDGGGARGGAAAHRGLDARGDRRVHTPWRVRSDDKAATAARPLGLRDEHAAHVPGGVARCGPLSTTATRPSKARSDRSRERSSACAGIFPTTSP